MPQHIPSVTQPVTTVCPNGKTCLTMAVFDPTINKHHMECDLYKLMIAVSVGLKNVEHNSPLESMIHQSSGQPAPIIVRG